MGKNKFNKNGIVYSTNPGFEIDGDHEEPEESIPKSEQQVKVQLDKKQRAGKVVTLIYGFADSNAAIEALGKEIKKFCGTGGSSKDGEVIIQGDFREKALQWLHRHGYKKAKLS